MNTFALLLLAVSVLVGSALPFVPTGEMVSGAAAVAAHSEANLVLIFLITWVCSIIGDTVMLLEARLGRRRVTRWLQRSAFGEKVLTARAAVTRNPFSALVTGRLIPGGRTPVIVALGTSRFSVRRFVLIDTVACALWAGIYSTLGSIGGRIASHPVWALVIAVAFAVTLGVLVQELRKLWTRWRERRAIHTGAHVGTGPASDRPRSTGDSAREQNGAAPGGSAALTTHPPAAPDEDTLAER